MHNLETGVFVTIVLGKELLLAAALGVPRITLNRGEDLSDLPMAGNRFKCPAWGHWWYLKNLFRRKANAHMGVTTKVPFYTSNPSTNTPATPKLTNLVVTLYE